MVSFEQKEKIVDQHKSAKWLKQENKNIKRKVIHLTRLTSLLRVKGVKFHTVQSNLVNEQILGEEEECSTTSLIFCKMWKMYVDATTAKKDIERELSREIRNV